MMGAETTCYVVVASLVLPSTVPARAVATTLRRGARQVALALHRFRLRTPNTVNIFRPAAASTKRR